jgi:selenium metabolism protein YedF
MERLDLRGQSCPVPVIETKRLIESQEVNEVEIIVDNTTSCENVRRFLAFAGFSVDTREREGDYVVFGTCASKETKETPSGKKVVVFVDSETVGRGSDELGSVLMRSFLFTLKEIRPTPWRIIFMNAGVRLVTEGSPSIEVLRELETAGAEILACGTCLDYFHLKEKVRAGRISNMYEILSSLAEATSAIKS